DRQAVSLPTRRSSDLIDRWNLAPGHHSFRLGRQNNPDILIVTKGQGALHWPGGEMALSRGEAAIVPATLSGYEVACSEELELIRSEEHTSELQSREKL